MTLSRPVGSLIIGMVCHASVHAGDAYDARMRQLASERGCVMCHTEDGGRRGGEDVLSMAPAWMDIARKYRGQGDAPSRLTATVLEGTRTGEPHWHTFPDAVRMAPNAQHIDEPEARELVRWILSMK